MPRCSRSGGHPRAAAETICGTPPRASGLWRKNLSAQATHTVVSPGSTPAETSSSGPDATTHRAGGQRHRLRAEVRERPPAVVPGERHDLGAGLQPRQRLPLLQPTSCGERPRGTATGSTPGSPSSRLDRRRPEVLRLRQVRCDVPEAERRPGARPRDRHAAAVPALHGVPGSGATSGPAAGRAGSRRPRAARAPRPGTRTTTRAARASAASPRVPGAAPVHGRAPAWCRPSSATRRCRCRPAGRTGWRAARRRGSTAPRCSRQPSARTAARFRSMIRRNASGSNGASSRSKLKACPSSVGRAYRTRRGAGRPGLGDRGTGRVVLVEHPTPGGEDLVHLVAVVQRVGAVERQRPARSTAGTGVDRSFARPCATSTRNPSTPRSDQKRSVSSKSARTSGFDQSRSGCSGANRCRYHCPSGTRVQALPPKFDTQSLGGSSPESPDPSRNTYRARSAEPGEDGQCGPEPLVLVRGVVRHDVDDDLQVVLVGGPDQGVEVVEGPELRVDGTVVGDVVAPVGERRREERGEPQRVDTERRQVRHPARDARDVTEPVAVGVGEAAWVDLVDDGIAPPVRVGRVVACWPGSEAWSRRHRTHGGWE